MQNIRLQKACHKYVPWVALLSLIIITIGVILWSVGSNRALDSTNVVLNVLGVEASSVLVTVRQAAIGAVVVCMLMAVGMVLMALGRTSLERKIDEQGRAVCGTWLWLAMQAVLAAVWWLILLWMVFVIFGSCVWYAAAYILEGALAYTLTLSRTLSQTLNSTAVPVNATTYIAGTNTTLQCPEYCFNSAYFSFYSSIQDRCVCESASLNQAWSAADNAARNLHLTVAGAFVMWVGTSFLLLQAAANFAATKRERELLLRAQRNAASAVSHSLAANMQPGLPAEYKDTQPLLHAPQHAVVQMQPSQAAMGMQQGMPAGMRPPSMMR